MTDVILAPGFQNQDGTGIGYEMLASSTYKLISITIANTARDDGNTPTTTLRKGILLQYDSGTGKYIELTAASGLAATCVVLPYDIPNIDQGDVVCKAFYEATFKKGFPIDGNSGSTEWADHKNECQRLKTRDNA